MKETADNTNTFAVYPKSTLWQRIRWWLFPIELCHPPSVDFENKDRLMIRVACRCSLFPRLMFLLTGRLVVEMQITTENVIGKHATTSACYVATKGMTNK